MIKRYTISHLFSWLLSRKLIRLLTPDSWFLFFRFKDHLGYYPNLNHPRTFNEKLQWLKLHNRNREYSIMVDKYNVRDYIASTIGEEYLIPLVGGPWKCFDKVDFDSLPSKFVLKCTHDSASVVICTEKDSFDRKSAQIKIEQALNNNYYYLAREWPYKKVIPQIIAERFMEDEENRDLRDYKFFCFDGHVEYFKIDINRFTNHRANYYDRNGILQPFYEESCPNDPDASITLPSNIHEMIVLAEILAKNIPFVRIDFYDINGKIYFGEITLFPAGGFGKIIPEEYDLKLGSLIRLYHNNE